PLPGASPRGRSWRGALGRGGRERVSSTGRAYPLRLARKEDRHPAVREEHCQIRSPEENSRRSGIAARPRRGATPTSGRDSEVGPHDPGWGHEQRATPGARVPVAPVRVAASLVDMSEPGQEAGTVPPLVLYWSA